MLAKLHEIVVSNTKYLAVAVIAASLAGGGATTVALVDNATPSPGAVAEDKKAEAAKEAAEKAAEKKAEAAEEKAEGEEGEGARPTDTHGYCVSQAVAAAHAAGKTGRDIAAAAHSCPKPNAAEKAARKAARDAAKAAR